MPRAKRKDKPSQKKLVLSIPESESKPVVVASLEAISLQLGCTYNGRASISALIVALSKVSLEEWKAIEKLIEK